MGGVSKGGGIVYSGLMDVWSLIGFVVISWLGGAVAGAVALILGGAGSLRVLARRLNVLEERQDTTEDRLTSEVKKRASEKGVSARRTAAQVTKEAEEVLEDNRNRPLGLVGRPSTMDRPSVARVK